MLLLNSVVDLLVPLYAVLVAVILLSFSRHSKDSRQNVYIYTPDKGSGAEPKNWKERLDGYWNQTDWDDLDGWLKYMKKPLPMRLIAPMTMKRLNMRITFLENYTKVRFQRDFGSGPTSFDAVLTIGDANFVQFVDDATGETNNMKCDLVEEDETMIISMKQKGMPDTRVVRRLLDNNTVEAVTEGTWSDDHSKGHFRAVFRRIFE